MPPPPTNGNRNAWLLDEIMNLVAGATQGVIGTNVFVNELPEPNVNGTPIQDGLYVISLPSPSPDGEIDTETHIIEFWTSSSSTNTAYQLMHTVYDILHRKANYALVNWYVYSSLANGIIKPEGRGLENNALFSLSFTVICRNLNNIS